MQAASVESLIELAVRHGTDKWGAHRYAQHYDRYFARLRDQPIRLLEIGVGGAEQPGLGAESLRMWRDYFASGMIFGIDLWDKSPHDEARIKTFRGSQDDPAFLARVVREAGPFDIVIDDGSHINRHVLKSFRLLFPHVKEGGVYAIEDTQTSYWPPFGGSSRTLASRRTTLGFAKGLVDALNFRERLQRGYRPTEVDRGVTGLHFHHNLVIVEKGANDEPSNLVSDGRLPDLRALERRERAARAGAG